MQRWVQLLLGLVCMIVISSPQYVWALFTKPMTDALGSSLPQLQVTFSILIVVSPETERSVRVWMLTTICDPDGDLASYDSFNKVIFDQDIVTVESQLPKRLPLDPRAEVHQRADRMSLAYRRWLVERRIGYGTSAADEPVSAAVAAPPPTLHEGAAS